MAQIHFFKPLMLTSTLAALLVMSSCTKSKTPEPKPEPGNPPTQNDDPIVLDCDYFSKNPNAVLIDNPNATVDYIVTCRMSIQTHIVIEPGVTIAFETDAGFNVDKNGSLKAVGTSEKKITFTGTTKSPGAWAGIMFESNDVKNIISYSIIEYGGGREFNSNKDKGNIIIYANALADINNNVIQHSATYGINFNYSSGEVKNFTNNTFKGNETPAFAHISKIDQIKGSNLFEDNKNNKFELAVTGTIKEKSTWHKLSIPYLVKPTTSILHCDINADVTIEPGTIIEMGAGTGMKINESGSLKIVGTPDQKIIIRGENQAAGSWGRIYYTHTQSPNNQISYAEIKHGGADPSSSKGAIYLWAKPRISIDNTHFSDILACAIHGRTTGGVNYQENLTVGENVTYTNVGGEVCGD